MTTKGTPHPPPARDALQPWIEQLAYDVENFASQSAAAIALRDAARSGVDLAPAVEVLTRAIEEATQVPVLEAAADALSVHLLQAGEGARLLDLAARLHWGSYLSTALVRTTTRGRDVSALVPLLCAPPGRRPRKLDPLPVLNAWLGRDPQRLAQVTALLIEHDRSLLMRLFRDHLLPRSGLDVSSALPTLVRLLEEGDPVITGEVPWLTYLASEASMDLSRVFTALEGLLTSKDEETRRRAAYSLASAQIRRGAWPEVARLGQHADGLVRGEVAHALCATLQSNLATAGEALGPLCLALIDPDAAVRTRAAEGLATAHREGRPIAPPPAVMEALLAGLRDPVVAGSVAEFLSLVFLQAPGALAPVTSALVAACTGSPDVAVQRLHRVCTTTDAPEPPCERCLRLPRHATWTSEGEAPPGQAELQQEGTAWRCPTCQTLYRRGYSSEHEDMSFSQEWSLDRLSPTEARTVVEGPAKTWLDEHFEHLLRVAEQRLEHPLRGVREEAAWVLAEHFGAARDLSRLGALLRHPDATVRATVATCLEARHRANPGWVVPEELLGALLRDAAPAVRRSAATMALRQALGQAAPQRVLALLRCGDAVVVVEAIRELRRAGSDGAAVAPFVGELLRLVGDAEAEVRKMVGWALGDVTKTPEQGQALVATNLRLLQGTPRAHAAIPDRPEMVEQIVAPAPSARADQGMTPLPDLSERSRGLAGTTLRQGTGLALDSARADRTSNRTGLKRHLVQPRERSRWASNAALVELRNEAADHLAALASEGVDISVALPTLARLMTNPKTAWHANAAVKAALGHGAPVGPVLGALIKGLSRKDMEREVDFAETLELAAQKQPAALGDALPVIARRLGTASETRRATLVRVIEALHRGGVDLSIVDTALERALATLEPYQREALVPLLMEGWLARRAWPRIKGLLRRRLRSTGWCVCEAVRVAGQGGLEFTPIVVDLVGLLESRNEQSRGYPLRALEEHFGRTQAEAGEVVAALHTVRPSRERDRLLARLAPMGTGVA